MSAELVVEGTAEVIGGLDAVKRASADMTTAHRGMVSRLIPEVRSRTPRRTGALAVSWSGGASATEATIESPLRYALPVEVGTSRMAGAHMVGDTLTASGDEIVAGYEEALADAGKRAGFGVER